MTAQKPSFSWHWNFLRGFLLGNFAYAMPYAVGIDVTSRCNLQCKGCVWHSCDSPSRLSGSTISVEDFDWELFDPLCHELQSFGTKKLTLIGKGEPLLHRKLASMIQRGKQAGMRIRLLTNGTLLNREWADLFVKLELDELQVSLWAGDEKEYSHNYPGTDPRFFTKVISGLHAVSQIRKELGSHSPRMVLHRPIDKIFFRNLPQMLEIARETGADAVSFSPFKPMGQSAEHEDFSCAEAAELESVLKSLMGKAKKLAIQTNVPEVLSRYAIGKKVWEKHPCYIGWVDARIQVNGDVSPCNTCKIVIGNIRESRLREIWNSASCQEFRKMGCTRRTNWQLAESCFCEFCCHVLTNARIDRFLGWTSERVFKK